MSDLMLNCVRQYEPRWQCSLLLSSGICPWNGLSPDLPPGFVSDITCSRLQNSSLYSASFYLVSVRVIKYTLCEHSGVQNPGLNQRTALLPTNQISMERCYTLCKCKKMCCIYKQVY